MGGRAVNVVFNIEEIPYLISLTPVPGGKVGNIVPFMLVRISLSGPGFLPIFPLSFPAGQGDDTKRDATNLSGS